MKVSRVELRAYLREELGVDTDDLNDSDLLFSDGFLDSFAVADLFVFLEESCDFSIDPEEVILENFDSIDRIVKFIDQKQNL